ncbi:MAG: DUF2586 family protein [Bacteroidales bacterium]|nr:DUF2586 family protein [Bacteroidales bacterium]
MASLKGVNIVRGAIGASVIDNADAVCGLLSTGSAVAADPAKGVTGIALGETVKLTCTADLAALGINESYDQKFSVFRHVTEFYRMAGEGHTLYLRLFSGKMSEAFTHAKQMIADADGEIRILAVAGTESESNIVYKDGLPQEVYNSIAKAQEFYDWTFETFRPCQVILEGYHFNAQSASKAADLRNLQITKGVTLEAFKVSVCIGQDYAAVDGLAADDCRRFRADVGTMLGSLAYRQVNENIAEVSGGCLTNAAKGAWLTAGLSNHQTIADWDSQLEQLDDKGFIFGIHYAGMSGFFWNNDYTCTPAIKDKDGYFNEYTISYGRVLDKAVRGLRTALLPYVKSSQPVDPETGKLPKATAAYFESVGDQVFERMIASGLITAGKTTVNADSDLLTEPRVLEVSFVIVPMGCIDEIKGTINLKTNL